MNKWTWNPKTKGSGVITCIPQKGTCPNGCSDCFFQSGRSYLEPLDVNLPHVPPWEMAKGRIVRMNDGHDSNIQRELVESVASQYDDYFFNTAIPEDLEKFSGPVVLTLNPGDMTDKEFHILKEIPPNLMFVRIRTNMWNLENVVDPAVKHYTTKEVPVVLTYMAYYTETVSEDQKCWYEWKKRTLNSYWVLNRDAMLFVEKWFWDNPYVHTCGWKGRYACTRCGNCIREYHNAKERQRAHEEALVGKL